MPSLWRRLTEQFAPTKDLFERVNLGLCSTFLAALEKSSVKRLVYISTCKVFDAKAGLIRESHALADSSTLSPYFAAMVKAYGLVQKTSLRHGISLTTIHPAAVYGGRDAGDGITHYLENIVNHRYHKIPTILAGRFPGVHTDSLLGGVIRGRRPV